MAHTPGPWKFYVGKLDEVPDFGMVCDLDNGMFVLGPENMTLGDYKDDAALIAAAPELLQELKNIAYADKSEWDNKDDFEGWARSRARFAIQKAEGGK